MTRVLLTAPPIYDEMLQHGPPTKRQRRQSLPPSTTPEPLVPGLKHELVLPPTTTATMTMMPTPTTAAAERLKQTLRHSTVLAFLALPDAVALLQSCRLLRRDPTLAADAARAIPEFAALFAHGVTDSNPDSVSLAAGATRRLLQPRGFLLLAPWADEGIAQQPRWSAPERPAQVLGAASFLHHRIRRWCFAYEPRTRRLSPSAAPTNGVADDLLVSVRPVLVALQHDHIPSPSAPWGRAELTAALEAQCPGAGEAFVDRQHAAESRFAGHWDSIYIDRVSGRVSCRLCDAARESLLLYRRQVTVAVRQYNLVLRLKEDHWTKANKTPDERAELTAALRDQYFTPTAYVRPECLEWPEPRLLRHIAEHGGFRAWAIGDTRARGVDSVPGLLGALAPGYQHQCRTFYQPLKRLLQRQCQVVGRIPHSILRGPAAVDAIAKNENEQEDLRTEIVGGVDCRTGIFTGVHVAFRVRRPPPADCA